MSDGEELVYETALDAPVEKVWRALTIPEYLDRWMQPPADAKVTLVHVDANSLLTYRLSEQNAESFVTFEVSPSENGGTHFRLTHTLAAANSNDPVDQPLMLAA